MKKILLVLAVMAVISAIVVWRNYDNFNEQVSKIEALHRDSQNVHAMVTTSLKSQGSVAEKYTDSVIKALEVSMQGRYGQGGSQAAVQWLKEQNPTIDAEIFKKLTSAIEASYVKFGNTQTAKLDAIRQYKASIKKFPGNMVASYFGFTEDTIKSYDMVVTTQATGAAFNTGNMEPVDLFKKN